MILDIAEIFCNIRNILLCFALDAEKHLEYSALSDETAWPTPVMRSHHRGPKR